MRALLVTVLVAACGGDNHSTADAPGIQIDAPVSVTGCTPSGTGKVTVDGPSSTTAIQVTFVTHAPDGTPIATSATMGADATVMLDVPACGMVSAIEVNTAGTEVLTWTNVQPGDHLVHSGHRAVRTQRTIAVTVPAAVNATEYDLFATCDPNSISFTSSTTPGTVMMTPMCSNGSVTISVTPKLATGNTVAVATATLAASGTTAITITGYQTTQSTLTMTGLGTASLVRFETYVAQGGNSLAVQGGTAVPSSGTAMVTAGSWSGAGGIDVSTSTMVANGTVQSVLARGYDQVASTIALAGTDMLAPITATLDATAPSVTWSSTATGAAALFEIRNGNNTWTIIGPATPGTLSYPTLPVGLWPTGTVMLTGVAMFESADLPSYHASNISNLGSYPAPGHQFRYTAFDATTSSAHTMKQRIGRWRVR